MPLAIGRRSDGGRLIDYREAKDTDGRARLTVRVITPKGKGKPSRVTIYVGREKVYSGDSAVKLSAAAARKLAAEVLSGLRTGDTGEPLAPRFSPETVARHRAIRRDSECRP